MDMLLISAQILKTVKSYSKLSDKLTSWEFFLRQLKHGGGPLYQSKELLMDVLLISVQILKVNSKSQLYNQQKSNSD